MEQQKDSINQDNNSDRGEETFLSSSCTVLRARCPAGFSCGWEQCCSEGCSSFSHVSSFLPDPSFCRLAEGEVTREGLGGVQATCPAGL
ncbi:hypothetical protein O3P69_019600 [Scylla paramamosain]|uniref:Uncharacterized protein n=1 Tax=Scylla paramamosain TaxID=85552 RepID=A0AAW0SYD9_SCYPA